MKKKNLQDETAITTSVTKKEMPELSLFVFLLQVSITPVQRHSKLSHTLGDVLHFKARLDTWTGKSKSEAMWRERTASPPKELPIVFFLEPVKEVLKSFFQIFFFLARIAAVPRAVSVNKAVLYLLLSAWRAIFLDPLRKSLEERTCDEEVCVCALL